MKNPLVTIAIPFYNDEKYLSFAIQSVINQTYPNWELLLIDDGGNDKSTVIATRYAQKDNRITLIRDGKNEGLAVRLNQSISLAKGEYYVRMDADDIMLKTRIEKQVAFLKEHPDVDVLGSSAMLIDSKNTIVGSADMSKIDTRFIHPSIIGKKEWFRNHPYAEWCKRCQDEELWLRTKDTSSFYNMEQPLLFYREQGTVTFSKYLSSQLASIEIRKHYKTYGKPLLWAVKSIIMLYLRILIYALFSFIGRIDLLTKKRKRSSINPALRLTKEDLETSIINE